MKCCFTFVLSALLAAETTLLQIRAIDADGAVHQAGSRSPGLTVAVTDEVGRPVAGAVVSFRLSEDGPGGAFANGLASEIVTTGADGRASTSAIRWNRIAGTVDIRVTAVKDRLRAGAIISQYLAEPGSSLAAPASAAKTSHPRHRLRTISLLVAVAAGAGFGAGLATRTRSSAAGSKAPAPVEIGNPTITLSKP